MIWDILVFPFKLVGQVTGWALDLTGHVLGFVVGLVLLILGNFTFFLLDRLLGMGKFRRKVG